jgi:flagellar protein FliO/FliZ
MKSHTFTRGAALVGVLLLAPAPAALAASGGSTTPSAGTGENTPLHLSGATSAVHTASGGSSGIVRTIVGLFIVIAVIYGVAWILRTFKGSKKNRVSGQGLTQLASLPLGSGRSVALVRAGTEVVLLGVAEHSVTPIRTYTEEEALELGIAVDDLAETEGPDGAPRATAARARGVRRGGQANFVDTLRRLTVRS